MTFIKKLKAVFFGSKTKAVSERIKKIGKVKFINRSKGYGFIKSEQTPKDVFMHFSDTEDYVSAGDRVKFYVIRETRGLRAKQVELA